MASTFDFLAEAAVAGSSTVFEITDIPTTHNDLHVIFQGYTDHSSDPDVGYCQVNGDTGDNYARDDAILEADGSEEHGEYNWTYANNWKIYNIVADSSGVPTERTILTIDINNYSNFGYDTSVKKKTLFTRYYTLRASGSPYPSGAMGMSGWYYGGDDPITRISFYSSNGNWETGTTVEVYGIANSA
jgi:hypothetical protein